MKSKTFFQVTDLENMLGPAPTSATLKPGHASILNQYGWLWLNRDGTPTLLAQKLYEGLLPGAPNTTENRVKLHAYLLAGETEFWRAYRHYAGVLHFVYLTSSDPGAFTSDHFLIMKTLELEPHFKQTMSQAFNPVGVYLNFWQPRLTAGSTREYSISLVNDEDRARWNADFAFNDEGGKLFAEEERSIHLEPAGAESYTVSLRTPDAPGGYGLDAVVQSKWDSDTVTSHREVLVAAKPK